MYFLLTMPSVKILTFVYEPSQLPLPLLKPLRKVSRAANDKLHRTLFPDLQGPQYILRVSDCPFNGTDMQSKFFQELNILAPIRKGVPPEVIYLFIAHTLMIPTLSLREMAQ